MGVSEVLAVVGQSSRRPPQDVGRWSVGCRRVGGLQTRPNRDLDLAVDSLNEEAALQVLKRRGYAIETDWRPVHMELVAAARTWVDLHPVVFDAAGRGRQEDLDGRHFDYPPEAFVQGKLSGVAVPACPANSRFDSIVDPRRAMWTSTTYGFSSGRVPVPEQLGLHAIWVMPSHRSRVTRGSQGRATQGRTDYRYQNHATLRWWATTGRGAEALDVHHAVLRFDSRMRGSTTSTIDPAGSRSYFGGESDAKAPRTVTL